MNLSISLSRPMPGSLVFSLASWVRDAVAVAHRDHLAGARAQPPPPGVVRPGHAEDRRPRGLADPFDDLRLGELGVLDQDRSEALEHLLDRLVELDLARVPLHHILIDRLHAFQQRHRSSSSPRDRLVWRGPPRAPPPSTP